MFSSETLITSSCIYKKPIMYYGPLSVVVLILEGSFNAMEVLSFETADISLENAFRVAQPVKSGTQGYLAG